MAFTEMRHLLSCREQKKAPVVEPKFWGLTLEGRKGTAFT